MIQYKAQLAKNGLPFLRAAAQGLDHLGNSLWASRETAALGVATLDKNLAITFVTRREIDCFPTRWI